MEKKLIKKCYEEMLVFLKDNFVEKSEIESLEDENNITDIIHIFTAIRKSEHRDPVKEDEIFIQDFGLGGVTFEYNNEICTGFIEDFCSLEIALSFLI